jgi:hypothetical protein
MLMKLRLIAAVATLAVTACGEENKEPVTADEVIAQAGELEKPRPGQYETKVELVDLSVPGLPAAQADRMKAMMGDVSAQASAYCLTEQEASKGFEESIRKMTEGSGGMKCEFKDFDVNGSKLTAALTCSGQQGLSADIALDGTASAEASAMRMKMTQKAAMLPGGEMRMEMKMDSRRIGDCT